MLYENACPLLKDKECRQESCAWWYADRCCVVWLAQFAEEQLLELERQELHQQQRSRIDAPLSDEE